MRDCYLLKIAPVDNCALNYYLTTGIVLSRTSVKRIHVI